MKLDPDIEIDDDLVDRAQRALQLGALTGADGERRSDRNVYVILRDVLVEIGITVPERVINTHGAVR